MDNYTHKLYTCAENENFKLSNFKDNYKELINELGIMCETHWQHDIYNYRTSCDMWYKNTLILVNTPINLITQSHDSNKLYVRFSRNNYKFYSILDRRSRGFIDEKQLPQFTQEDYTNLKDAFKYVTNNINYKNVVQFTITANAPKIDYTKLNDHIR